MPILEVVGDELAQLAMDAGGDAIKRLFGWKGCVVALILVIGAIALVFWVFS
jgi:hypothetical protein